MLLGIKLEAQKVCKNSTPGKFLCQSGAVLVPKLNKQSKKELTIPENVPIMSAKLKRFLNGLQHNVNYVVNTIQYRNHAFVANARPGGGK